MIKARQKISLFFVSMLLASGIAHSANELPKLGEVAGATLSVAEEQIYGDQIMAQIRRSNYLLRDPIINDYIQQLGHRLVAANPDALGRRFHFFAIQEPSINAFALPGGYIGIHTGLITSSGSESELASVFGHEIAHVTQRHLARRLEKQNEISWPTILGVLGSLIAASQDPEAGMAGITATQAAAQQTIINHTRSNEEEADRIGIPMLSAAGFDARAAADFFETLQKQSRFSRKPPEILLTHPLSRNRIANTRSRAEQYPIIEHQDSLDYQLIRARVKSLEFARNNDHFAYLKNKHEKQQLKATEEEYLYSELLTNRGNFEQAIKILEGIYKRHTGNSILLFSLAEAHLSNKTQHKVLPLLIEQLKKTPSSTKLLLATAKVYLANKKAEQAVKLLLRYAELNKNNPTYLFTLAQAQSSANHVPEMHETTGQYLLLLGDYRTAKQHFELALSSYSKDPYAQTRIQARLEKVRKKMREILEENSRSRLTLQQLIN